jgi:hypothetical protein
MQLPGIVAALVKAQNELDSAAYAGCFTETAVVLDEGKTHRGRNEIQSWIDQANRQYRAVMQPMRYSATDAALTAEVSGNFPGSPVKMTFFFELKEGLIQWLKIV